jgi:hypothetical protein
MLPAGGADLTVGGPSAVDVARQLGRDELLALFAGDVT